MKRFLLVLALGFAIASPVGAATVDSRAAKFLTDCSGGGCMWSITVDGAPVEGGMGTYAADPTTGDLSFSGPARFELGDGAFVSLDGINGNIDPILGFSASAGTGAVGKTFAFAFSLPIALAGPIDAKSQVSYSLTGLTPAGAQIQPFVVGGKVVTANEVDSSVGGLAPLNKGVDVGNTFFFVGGPQTQNSPVYSATSTLVGSLDYDLMSVVVAFTLSANSQVGLSGFVEQLPDLTPIPEPTTLSLLIAGMAMVGWIARRRIVAA